MHTDLKDPSRERIILEGGLYQLNTTLRVDRNVTIEAKIAGTVILSPAGTHSGRLMHITHMALDIDSSSSIIQKVSTVARAIPLVYLVGLTITNVR